jgi:hypothetical protein
VIKNNITKFCVGLIGILILLEVSSSCLSGGSSSPRYKPSPKAPSKAVLMLRQRNRGYDLMNKNKIDSLKIQVNSSKNIKPGSCISFSINTYLNNGQVLNTTPSSVNPYLDLSNFYTDLDFGRVNEEWACLSSDYTDYSRNHQFAIITELRINPKIRTWEDININYVGEYNYKRYRRDGKYGKYGKSGLVGKKGEPGKKGDDLILNCNLVRNKLTKEDLLKIELINIDNELRKEYLIGVPGSSFLISSTGGHGGNGGKPGKSEYDNESYKKRHPVIGGNGGNGGDGGDISINFTKESIVYKDVFIIDNKGGKAGSPYKNRIDTIQNGQPGKFGRKGKITFNVK